MISPDTATPATRWYSLRGRAGRGEFWKSVLWMIPISLAGGVVLMLGLALLNVFCGEEGRTLSAVFAVVVALCCSFPFFSVLNRRLRDAGLAGWLAFPAWGNFLLSVALLAGVGPPIVRDVLTTAAPISERYDHERSQLHLRYGKAHPAMKKSLDDCERAELRQATMHVVDHWLKTSGTLLHYLSSTTEINFICFLFVIVVGLLPSRGYRLSRSAQLMLYAVLSLLMQPPAIARLYHSYTELNYDESNALANAHKDYAGWLYDVRNDEEESVRVNKLYQDKLSLIRAERESKALQPFILEWREYPIMSTIRLGSVLLCSLVFVYTMYALCRHREIHRKEP